MHKTLRSLTIEFLICISDEQCNCLDIGGLSHCNKFKQVSKSKFTRMALNNGFLQGFEAILLMFFAIKQRDTLISSAPAMKWADLDKL